MGPILLADQGIYLDYAEALTAPGGMMADLIDMTQVAVVGHSYGGYTALAAAGAQHDMQSYRERCATIAADDPLSLLRLAKLRLELTGVPNEAVLLAVHGSHRDLYDPSRLTGLVLMLLESDEQVIRLSDEEVVLVNSLDPDILKDNEDNSIRVFKRRDVEFSDYLEELRQAETLIRTQA